MKSGRPWAKVVAALYLLVVGGALASAAYLWRLPCEGFGCTGIGIAWFAWTLLFLLASALGLVARHLSRLDPSAWRAVHWTLLAQLAAGAFLVAAWALHRAS